MEGFAQVKLQGHEGFDVFASVGLLGTDLVGDAGVASGITAGLELNEQRFACAPVLFIAAGVGFKGKLEFVSKNAQFAKSLGTNLLGYFDFLWRLEPFLQGVARQPRALCYCTD